MEETLICPQCFNEFVKCTWNHKFCSVECQRDFGKDIYLKSVGLRRKLKQEKGGCQICGYNKWESCLEWHHVDPGEKKYLISGMGSCSDEEIKQEINKCVLLCCNCHQEIHRGNKETLEKVLDIFKKQNI